MKRISLFLVSLLAVVSLASAQAKAPLQILCNVSGAQVFLAGQLVGSASPNLILNIKQGTYALKVIKMGFNDFDTVVTIGPGGAAVQANLVPRGGNPAPAAVQAPNTIPAPAPAPVPVQPPPMMQVPVILNYALSVLSNVDGASVTINGNPAGTTPFRAQVPNGNYSIVVSADGYRNFKGNFIVNNGPMVVNAPLQSMLASWKLKFNEGDLEKYPKLGQLSGIQVFVDGELQAQAPGATIAQGQFEEGIHRIRMVVGGMILETRIDADAGKYYIVEPSLTVREK